MILAAAAFFSALAASASAAPPVPTPAFFASHRDRLFAKLPAGSIAVFRSAPETNVDAVSDPYRQDSNLWYLTGLEEPDAVAVFLPGEGGKNRFLLFVRPKDFAAEQWTGWRAGVEGARKDHGAEAYPIGDFWSRFPALSASAQVLTYGSGSDEAFQTKLLQAWNAGNANATAPRPAADAEPLLAEMRLIKDPLEQALLREACHISADAHVAAMAQVGPGRNEWDLKAAMVGLCLSRGAARMAYPPIVGSGRNGTVLHYVRDNEPLEVGEMIVNDTGCEYNMYAADVTRSYPVSGKFSPEQRKIYEIVLAAQNAGFAKVRPGVPFHEVHDATVGVIVDGLLGLGILAGDRAEIIRSRAYQKFYPHGSSHWLGLNVHDAGSYDYPTGVARLERYGKAQTKLAPGMALSVEPGIYIPQNSTADSKWWNIGVRIEDDVLVTSAGMECLSCGAPRELADVEKAVARGQAKRASQKAK